MATKKKVIGILTGGGDVPGLNPAIRAITIRALREGFNSSSIKIKHLEIPCRQASAWALDPPPFTKIDKSKSLK